MKRLSEHLKRNAPEPPENWERSKVIYNATVEKLHKKGIGGIMIGGNACYKYGLVQFTKDCDIVVAHEKIDTLVNFLKEEKIDGSAFRYTSKYGGPIHERWFAGGWSGHIFLGEEDTPDARFDFFSNPPRGENLSPDEYPYYLCRDTVAYMKRTQREKDWKYPDRLGVQMLERGDPRGLLHVQERTAMFEAIENIGKIPEDVLRLRPLLQLAKEKHPDLGICLEAEAMFWVELDKERMACYKEAILPYREKFQSMKGFRTLDFKNQHDVLVDIAYESLEPNPLAKVGTETVREKALISTKKRYPKVDSSLMPEAFFIHDLSNNIEMEI